MRVLVTGGAGFIGSHVVDDLLERGREVRVFDSFDPSAHAGEPAHLRRDAELQRGDLLDAAAVGRAVRGVDAVAHLAARVGLGVDFADAPAYAATNGVGTARLLAALQASGFGGRLVLAGSMVVYGEGRYRCPDHGVVRPGPREPDHLAAGRFEPPCPACRRDLLPEAVPEDAPVDPRNVYAATKLHQEHLCAAFSRETGAPLTVLRYHNVYGPRMPVDTPYAGVASIFRSALAAGRPPEVFEDGRQLRDFVHVRDVAAATAIALTAEPAVPGVYNVASGTPRSIGEVAAAIAAVTNPALRPRVTGRYRLGDVRHVFASPARAAAALGFRGRVPFEDGMAELAGAPLRPSSRHPARSGRQ